MPLHVDHEQVQVRIPTTILSLLPPPSPLLWFTPRLFSLSSCLLVAIPVVQCAICGFYHHRPPIMHCFHRKFGGEWYIAHSVSNGLTILIFLFRTISRVSYMQENHLFAPRLVHISRYTGQNRRERRDVYQASAFFVSCPFSHLLFRRSRDGS